MKTVILAGAAVRSGAELAAAVAGAELVIAADSGLRHALPLGLTPQVIIGDFDSVAAADLAAWPDVPRVRHPAAKDALDLELALQLAVERGATSLVLVGVTGGRLDQTLAALLIAARWHRQLPVTLESGVTAVWPLHAGDSLQLKLPALTRFSLLSLTEASLVSVTGATWPLQRTRLEFGSGHGVSNTVSGAGDGLLKVLLHEGTALLLLEREP